MYLAMLLLLFGEDALVAWSRREVDIVWLLSLSLTFR